jgi:uncharacterized membrane protein
MQLIIFTIIAYFCWAVTNVVDKKFLSAKVKNASVFTIFAGFILLFETVWLVPLGFRLPSAEGAILSIIGGASFIYALAIYFAALGKGDASVIVPLTSFTGVFSLIFSSIFFGIRLTTPELVAFALLIIGAIIFSIEERNTLHYRRSIVLVLLADVVFGFSYSFQAEVYHIEPFLNGFIWLRIFGFLATISLLSSRVIRRQTLQTVRSLSFKSDAVFVSNQFLAFVALLMLNYSFKIGNVAVVNALQGLQYVFVLLFVIVLHRYNPSLLQERITRTMILKRVLAVGFIVAGVVVLAFVK